MIHVFHYKFLALLMLAASLVGFSGCGSDSKNEAKEEPAASELCSTTSDPQKCDECVESAIPHCAFVICDDVYQTSIECYETAGCIFNDHIDDACVVDHCNEEAEAMFNCLLDCPDVQACVKA